MKISSVILLQINGWTAVLIGSLILIDPVGMFSTYGLQSNLSSGLLSELRAPGGLLLACGIIIIRNTLREELYEFGLQLSIMVYGGYGFSRLLSFAFDGAPPIEIMFATVIELMLCLLSMLVLWKRQKNSGFSKETPSAVA
ncbi:MAG: hypothetical protein CMP91_00290 [Gammaproteobacteria bacterium]|nr:hypothetical protein [Gammaproteobacteria bacterium]MAY03911.1 hypothetical protein [Gammaproteobacteria bacterium]|tara:strand:+ start:1468 stop:1890 length:423 start_codon:yes stop_codon:yes gene_type:complete